MIDDGAGQRQEQAVAHRGPEAGIVEHGAVVVERQPARRIPGRRAVVFLQRRPHQHQERQQHDDDEVEHEQRRREPAPAAEIDGARAEALAGDGREARALIGQPRLQIDAEAAQHQQRDRVGRRQPDLARILVDRLVDRRGIDVDADRQPEQRRHLERFDRAHEQDQQRAEHRRPGELEGDAIGDLQDRGAAHLRGFLERGVHGAERRGHQQERDRGIVQPVDPDHPRHGVDVEEHVVGAEQPLQRHVEDPDLRAREQHPRHREQDAGDHQRDDREREEQLLERRVGALVHPGERGADQQREHRGAGREHHRIDEQPEGLGAEIGGAEIVERELRRPRRGVRRQEALPDQEGERHDRKPHHQRDRNADQDPAGIESPARGSACGNVPSRPTASVMVRLPAVA